MEQAQASRYPLIKKFNSLILTGLLLLLFPAYFYLGFS